VTALDVEPVAVAEHDGPEAVPLGLEQPAVARGLVRRELREHRLDRRLDRETHGRVFPSHQRTPARRAAIRRSADGALASVLYRIAPTDAHRYTARMGKPKALLSWSSGKDSAWALHVLRERAACELVGLVTTINEAADRVAMHAVRAALLEAQAEAVGLRLWPVPIPSPCSNEQYEAAMTQVVERGR